LDHKTGRGAHFCPILYHRKMGDGGFIIQKKGKMAGITACSPEC